MNPSSTRFGRCYKCQVTTAKRRILTVGLDTDREGGPVYAVVRQTVSRWGDDMPVLVRQVRTLPEAQAVARQAARSYGQVIIEHWTLAGRGRGGQRSGARETVIEVVTAPVEPAKGDA